MELKQAQKGRNPVIGGIVKQHRDDRQARLGAAAEVPRQGYTDFRMYPPRHAVLADQDQESSAVVQCRLQGILPLRPQRDVCIPPNGKASALQRLHNGSRGAPIGVGVADEDGRRGRHSCLSFRSLLLPGSVSKDPYVQMLAPGHVVS